MQPDYNSLPKTVESQAMRDLSALIRDRVQDAVLSVLQLTDTPEERFQLAVHGMMNVAAAAAASFAASKGIASTEIDPLDLLVLVVASMGRARAERDKQQKAAAQK